MKLLVVLVIMLSSSIAWGWPGTILSVSDGDTLVVAPCGDAKTPVAIRLYGIDAPEREQSGGSEAATWLRDALPVGSVVEIIPQNIDKYGRSVALVALSGNIVNRQAVESGQAWVYAQYCKARFCRKWKTAEKRARHNQIGLWHDADAVAPWDWRRAHKKNTPRRSTAKE